MKKFGQSHDFASADPDESRWPGATVATLRASEAQPLLVPRIKHRQFHEPHEYILWIELRILNVGNRPADSKHQFPHSRQQSNLKERSGQDRPRVAHNPARRRWIGRKRTGAGLALANLVTSAVVMLHGGDDQIGFKAGNPHCAGIPDQPIALTQGQQPSEQSCRYLVREQSGTGATGAKNRRLRPIMSPARTDGSLVCSDRFWRGLGNQRTQSGLGTMRITVMASAQPPRLPTIVPDPLV